MPARGVDPDLSVTPGRDDGQPRVILRLQSHMRIWLSPARARKLAEELLTGADAAERTA